MVLAPRGGQQELPGVPPAGTPRTASTQCLQIEWLGTPLGQVDGDALVLSRVLACAPFVLTWQPLFFSDLRLKLTNSGTKTQSKTIRRRCRLYLPLIAPLPCFWCDHLCSMQLEYVGR